MKKEKFKQFFSSFFGFYMGAELDITSVAVAYYLMISIFPILFTLANLLPYFQIDVQQILVFLEDIFPEKLYPSVAEKVVNILTQPSGSLLGISVFASLWTVSGSMAALQKAFNKAYGVEEHRDFIISRLVGVILGIALQLIITLSVLMITFGNTILRMLQDTFLFENTFLKKLHTQTGPVAYLFLFLALLMIYFVLPNVRIRKIRYIFPGVLFVMVVTALFGKLFSIYVDSYANKLLDFRFATLVIVLVAMLWFVFISNVLITGAVLNATVQSMQVEEFDTRRGDVVSILNRIKDMYHGKKQSADQ